MTTPTRPRRWGLVVPWALALALLIGWCGYWFALRATALARAEAWSQTQAEQTGAPGFTSVRASGFPLRLTLEMRDVSVRLGRDGHARTARLAVFINPADPRQIQAAAPDPIVYRIGGGPERVATARMARASWRQEGETILRWSIEAEDVHLAAPDAPPNGGVFVARLIASARPDVREPDAAGMDAVQLAADVDGLRLAAPVGGFERLGATLETVRLRAVVTHAGLLADGDTGGLDAWRQAGGRVRVEGADVLWGGAGAQVRGDLGLDGERRIAGRLEADMREPEALVRALAGDRLGGLGGMLARALEALDAEFIAEAGVLSWRAQTLGLDLGEGRIRDLPPVYGPPSPPPPDDAGAR